MTATTLAAGAEKELWLPTPHYCESIYQTRRRPTRTIHVRDVLEWGSMMGRGLLTQYLTDHHISAHALPCTPPCRTL